MTYSGGATTSTWPSTSSCRARASPQACNGSRPLRYTSALKPELCWREYLGQPGDVPPIQHYDQIHIMGQARLSINDNRHAPADHVGYAQRVQPLCEHQKEVSFGHTRKSCERPDGWLRRSNLGVPRATQPPLIAGRKDTAVRPPAISGPATLLAAPVALR